MKAYGNVITGTVGAQSLDLPTTPAARQCSAERAEHGYLCAGQALQPLSKRKTQPHRK